MILIVDDKEENLFSLKSFLRQNAYDVDTSSSGQDALKKILRNEYTLIILDVQMPDMDGFEVAEIITTSSKAKDIPIIFLSAVSTDKRFIAKGYASGAVDYVTKPFDPDLLLLKVKTFQRLYSQSKKLNEVHRALLEEAEHKNTAQAALQEANLRLEDRVKERTRELEDMNEELELRNTELQQYASVASHDLQEPLRKIITFSNILEEKFTTNIPDANRYMQKIISSAIRMRSLINDLLNFSKLSVDSDFISTDLTAIINGTLNDLELLIKEKDGEVITEKLPCIDAIPGQMRQMLQNIIANALKFSREGATPLVKIWSEYTSEKSAESPASENGAYLRIYIEDNGIGFDEKYLDKIFVLFQRLHTLEKYKGTGIGLAIAKKIIDKHNGILTARSKENEGATFIIVLPVKHSEQQIINKSISDI